MKRKGISLEDLANPSTSVAEQINGLKDKMQIFRAAPCTSAADA